MPASIPASAIVNIVPGVIGVGGSGLDLVGLFLTDSTRVPIGTVRTFANAPAVALYFGPTSPEAGLAATYFAGYVGSTIKPAAMLFVQYPTAAVGAYLRGGPTGLTLTQLQALTGVLTVTVDGAVKTSSTINLAGATSFSNAATLIQAGFTTPGFAVTFDSVSGAFVLTNTDSGTVSTISFASGSLAAGLGLTAANGAVLSQGAAQATPAAGMAGVIALTQNFASFSTTFKPSIADMVSFAQWTDSQTNRFVYVGWDNDLAPTTSSDTTSFGYQVRQLGYSGTVPIYDPNSGPRIAAFLMGALASINFQRANARVTAAFRSGAGLPAGVSSQVTAANLQANGYNYYGSFATAAAQFTFLYPGQITGPFLWIDSFINEVWLNSSFQLALMNLLSGTGSIPYNADGYALIETALQPAIAAGVAFGAIRAGVPLSSDQIAQLNAAAGRDIATTVQQRGWYTLVLPATAQVRLARSTPPIYFWYADGQSVQQITLSSVAVE